MSVKPTPLFDSEPATPEADRPLLTAAPAPQAAPAATASAPRRLPPMAGRYLVRVLALLAAVLIWHLATATGFNLFINFENVPAPLLVGQTLIQQLGSSEFYLHIVHSLERIALAYAYAVVLGVLCGVLIGRSRWAEDILLPYIELFRPIPAVAWIPLAILMLPTEQSSIVFITFLGAFFPILLNSIHGVEAIDPVLLRAARSLGAREHTLLFEVVLPAALPHIFTGLAVGMGVAWVSLIAAEMISGQFGIGYFTWEAYSLISYPEIALGMITIGILGLLCSSAIRLTSRLAMPWQASASPGERS